MNCQICGAQLPAGTMFCGECGSSTTATSKTRKRPDLRPSDTTVIPPLPLQPTVISVPIDTEVRIEAAPSPVQSPVSVPVSVPESVPESVAAASTAASATEVLQFELQFSTGETVSVHGSGLIGRRPLPEPSEHFDHLIQIADSGMSVSKSHLEFGQHGGEFWVSDRFSGNGTILRRLNEAALRCEAGRRYLVPRGSRVEIADQFFVLS